MEQTKNTALDSDAKTDRLEIGLDSYRNHYNRKIDIDVFKENEVGFFVDTDNRNFSRVIYESHKVAEDEICYTIYIRHPDGTVTKDEGGDVIVRKPSFTIYDLLGMSSFRHSRKSKDIKLVDWKKIEEAFL